MPENIEVVQSFTQYEQHESLPPLLKTLVDHAVLAAKKAYAPYSKFLVGAAIADADGHVHTGNNQENAAYPSGMCAERVALFAAKASDPSIEITTLAVVAVRDDKLVPAPPCGSCRQTILEYSTTQKGPIQVLFGWEKGTFRVANSIEDLLPLNFTSENLNLKPDLP